MADAVVAGDEQYDDLFQLEKAAVAWGTGVIEEPYPIWTRLREAAPVHRGTLAECMGMPAERMGVMYAPGVFHTAFSFQACSEAFLRKEDFSNESYVDLGTVGSLGDQILNMDGLRHRRYRDLIQPLFLPSAAETWWREKAIGPVLDELLATFEQEGSVNINAVLFSRVPLHTITAGFGLTLEEGVFFRQQMHNLDYSASDWDERKSDTDNMIFRIIRDRQAHPQDDVISWLAHAELEEDDGRKRHLSVEEIAGYCRQILTAGSDTTWRQLGSAMFALLNNPDQLQAVIEDRSLVGAAILEAARWHPPDPVFPRKVIRDTVLQGAELPAGTGLHLCLSAANRDPNRWDDPDRFDIFRPIQRSLAFGAGHHSCLGQHVSRQEMVQTLNAVFDRFPNIRWDASKPPAKLTGGLIQRGPNHLYVLLA